jgi:molybdate transport system substrate-binding protein
VTFNFAASSALAVQINEGAPADVFASADAAQMQAASSTGRIGTAGVFATNLLVVVVPGEGAPVSTFADLAEPGVRLVLAAPEVPAGKYARESLEKASRPGGISGDFSERVLANLRSNEANVRAVLTKVQLGEADAGFVYQTDIPPNAGGVKAIQIPPEYNVVAEYLIGAVGEGGTASPVAHAFVAFVLSDEGQTILRRHGFISV